MHSTRDLEPYYIILKGLKVPCRHKRLAVSRNHSMHWEERVQFSSQRVYMCDKLFKLRQKYT